MPSKSASMGCSSEKGRNAIKICLEGQSFPGRIFSWLLIGCWGIFSWLLIGCWRIFYWLLIGCWDFFPGFWLAGFFLAGIFFWVEFFFGGNFFAAGNFFACIFFGGGNIFLWGFFFMGIFWREYLLLLKHILMAFSPLFTYEAHCGMFWWRFVPFSLIGPIKADFDGISPLFQLWSPLRHVLMAFCRLLIYGAH